MKLRGRNGTDPLAGSDRVYSDREVVEVEVVPEGALVPADRTRKVYHYGDCELSAIGIDFPAGMEAKHWQQLGALLFKFYDRMSIWIGDWLVHGETVYGVTYEAIADQTGKSKGTLYNWKSVMQSVERSRRRENLYFGHYASVASLEPDKQAYWLNLASAGDGEKAWSVKVFQAHLPNYSEKPPLPSPTKDPVGYVLRVKDKFPSPDDLNAGERLQLFQLLQDLADKYAVG